MGTSDKHIDVPAGAPGPSPHTIGEEHRGQLVIYDTGDAGWETRIEIPIDSPWAITNLRDLQ